MKKIILLLLAMTQAALIYPQKRAIDAATCESWPVISGEMISGDGQYVAYQIGSQSTASKLIVQAVESKQWVEITKAGNYYFSGDSKHFIYFPSKDSMVVLTLGTDHKQFISGLSDFKMPKDGNSSWVAYRIMSAKNELVLYNVGHGSRQRMPNISEYFFSEDGSSVIAIAVGKKDNDSTTFFWLDLNGGITDSIHCKGRPGNFVVDNSGTRMSFLCAPGNHSETRMELCFFRRGSADALRLVDDITPAMRGLKISSSRLTFNANATQVFFYVEKDEQLKKSAVPMAKVNVWNYQDAQLQTQQMRQINNVKRYAAVFNMESNIMIRLQQDQDSHIWEPFEAHPSYVMGFRSNFQHKEALSDDDETFGNAYFFVDTRNGVRTNLGDHFSGYSSFSPGGKYIISFDRKEGHYYCYDIQKGRAIKITAKIPVPLYIQEDHPDVAEAIGMAGWLEGETAVLIYDRYDIWKVDPTGVKQPKNLTQGLGNRNRIRFRYLNLSRKKDPGIISTKELVLSAFDEWTKDNGFYQLSMGPDLKLERLIMGPTTYFFYYKSMGPTLSGICDPELPLKANSADRYLLKQMSASQYPNLVVTNNFRDFTTITQLAPQKDYSWFNTELLQWKLADGTPMEGILYKPENLDTTKKYPVIFFYYESLSDALNLYLFPVFTGGSMNIPWFVSNGYIVCAPNIHFKTGFPGESSFNSVMSAAQHLLKRSYIDRNRMGIQGHSFAGYQTNYIVTRTNLFAAASAGAGVSNLVSAYGGLLPNGASKHSFYERRQGRLGATLWEKEDLYVRNSPIFNANKVKTPLLLLHNSEDNAVPFAQSLEWYTALQSLGKKVWMLQYDGEGHVLRNTINKKDWSIRLMQFFDHYLKGKPMPVWMSQGVSAKDKGMVTGLEIGQ